MLKIKVHEKALAHLSRGLYRSPASALRELVSNAWDANATIVRIDTNYPNFFQISVEDNGDGFTREEFSQLMSGGIGNSTKRTTTEKQLINGRPVIGRLGIGLLGIAQICGSFTIASNPKHGKGFAARVKLFDLLKDKLDTNAAEVVSEVKTDGEESIREVDVGEYEFINGVDTKLPTHGTRIVSEVVHPTFTNAFQKSLNFEKFKEPPREWGRAVKIASKVHTLHELGDYWRLLWEMSVSCPLPYLDANSLPQGLVKDEQALLESYKFRVVVDGIELAKPVSLRRNPGGYTVLKIRDEERKIYGKSLNFRGYILVQEGRQIQPDELRGILIRIRNVGIGYYDASMLDYRFNEGPRAKWLTGEIYVDQGLEDALNIDRDSFNRFHPEYRALQEFIHQILHAEIFPKVYKNIDVRSDERQKTKGKERDKHLRQVLEDALGVPITIHQASKSKQGEEDGTASILKRGKGLEITIPEAEKIGVKKQNQDLAAAMLTIFEVSLQEKDINKRRRMFQDLLQKLLAKW